MSIVYDNLTIDQIDGRVAKAVEISGRRGLRMARFGF